jgi:hypothetical protein
MNPSGQAMRIKPTRALAFPEICREAYQRQRLGAKGGHIDFADERH